MYALQIPGAEGYEHCLVRISGGGGQPEVEAERGGMQWQCRIKLDLGPDVNVVSRHVPQTSLGNGIETEGA